MNARRFNFGLDSVTTTAQAEFSLRDRKSLPTDAQLVPVVETSLEAAAPSAVFLPQPYEPKYAYPLIVWVQPTGCRLAPLNQIMSVLSERNYLGTVSRLALSVSDPLKALSLGSPAAFGVNPRSLVPWNWLQEIRRDVLHARRQFHVHSERIYLAGIGPGATAATQLLLAKPEWFAGAIALDPMISMDQISMRQFRGLADKRLFISSRGRNPVIDELQHLSTLAGLDVTQKTYRTAQSMHRRVLLDVDSWIMSRICQLQYA